MTEPTLDDAVAAPVMYCANHPDTETLLRCNKCGKPICFKCAVRTEVGYRCKECIHEQQNVFYTAMTSDNWIAFAVAAGITLVAWPIVGFLFSITRFFGWIIAALIGSGAGATLAQIIRNSVGRRRGRYIRHFTLAGIVVGLVASGLITSFWFAGFLPFFSLGGLIFVALALGTAFQTLR
jgi:MFS family permease